MVYIILYIMSMIRKQVYLRPDQDRRLKQLAKALGISEAELIRQSVDQAVLGATTHPDLEAWKAEVRFARQRQARGSLPGGRDWTRESIYGGRSFSRQ